jgi:hypothetical protein
MTANEKIVCIHNLGHADAEKITSTVRLIGPQEAAQMLDTMKYEYQRNIDRSHVAALVNEMIADRFIKGTTIRIAYLDGEAHIIDGQHRLSAVVSSKKPQIFTVIEETAPDADHIAWAYGNIDTGRVRSASDLYRPMGLHAQLDLTSRQINALSAAVDIIFGGMIRVTKVKRSSKSEKMRLMELYAPFMKEYNAIVSHAPSTIAIRRAYVVAVGVLSLRFSTSSPNGASTSLFWRGVATDDRLESKDPRKVVHKHLMLTTMRGDAFGTRVSSAYGARYIATCYNAYMKGESRVMAKVLDETAPFKMTGIPSDQRQWLK